MKEFSYSLSETKIDQNINYSKVFANPKEGSKVDFIFKTAKTVLDQLLVKENVFPLPILTLNELIFLVLEQQNIKIGKRFVRVVLNSYLEGREDIRLQKQANQIFILKGENHVTRRSFES